MRGTQYFPFLNVTIAPRRALSCVLAGPSTDDSRHAKRLRQHAVAVERIVGSTLGRVVLPTIPLANPFTATPPASATPSPPSSGSRAAPPETLPLRISLRLRETGRWEAEQERSEISRRAARSTRSGARVYLPGPRGTPAGPGDLPEKALRGGCLAKARSPRVCRAEKAAANEPALAPGNVEQRDDSARGDACGSARSCPGIQETGSLPRAAGRAKSGSRGCASSVLFF
jgi:hypothetical protein